MSEWSDYAALDLTAASSTDSMRIKDSLFKLPMLQVVPRDGVENGFGGHLSLSGLLSWGDQSRGFYNNLKHQRDRESDS